MPRNKRVPRATKKVSFDEALDVNPKVVAVEPIEVTKDEAIDNFVEDYNPYEPPSESAVTVHRKEGSMSLEESDKMDSPISQANELVEENVSSPANVVKEIVEVPVKPPSFAQETSTLLSATKPHSLSRSLSMAILEVVNVANSLYSHLETHAPFSYDKKQKDLWSLACRKAKRLALDTLDEKEKKRG